jgi:dihydroorotate dehydrogenase (NAD+) catalytic subunit
MADLKTDLGKIKLNNPVMTASGTFGYGSEYNEYFDISKLGAVVVKGISSFIWEGNPTPRIAETSSGMLNSIGLQNPGVEKFLHGQEYLPFLKKCGATVIVNIWGRSVEEYCDVASKLEAEKDGIAALEINISCPNIKAGGIAFGTDLNLLARVISEIRKETSLPLITKLSPNVSNIADFRKGCGRFRKRYYFPDKHINRHVGRHRNPQTEDCEHKRRTQRPCHKAGCGQDGI